MKQFNLLLIFILLLGGSCDKKTPDYSQINLVNFKGEQVAITSMEGEWRVYVFLSPECPLSENYTLTLSKLKKEFESGDIKFHFVFPGMFYPRPQIEQFVMVYGLSESSIHYDPAYQLRDYCKATITPEVFVIDQLGVILYRGAIDNWAITLGKQRQVITKHYLFDALSQLSDNQVVKLNKTRAVGCIIE